jgi:trehalose 6-phosphate phosphatase
VNTSADDPTTLAGAFRPVSDHLVLVDFDGTIAPIVDHPADASPLDGALAALDALAARTVIAIVSGRAASDLRPRLGGLQVLIAGGHGTELHHPEGTVEHLVDLAAVAGPLDGLEGRLRALLDAVPGWLVERKEASVAVHHRLAAPASVVDLLPRIDALLAEASAAPPGFAVVHGKAVVELRPAGTDKGRAVAAIAARHPGLRPVMIGDDVTDEDAFRTVSSLGGRSILVADEPRDTAAQHRLLGPPDVVAFLAALAGTEA